MAKLTKDPSLEPCPFCGGTVKLNHQMLMIELYSIECPRCGAHVFFYYSEHSRAGMIAAWNRRAKNDQPD